VSRGSRTAGGTRLQGSLLLVWSWLTRRRRVQLGLLLLLSLAGAAAELGSLGAVLPFLGLLANPDMAVNIPVVGRWLGASGGSLGVSLLPVTALFALLVLTAAGLRLVLTWASVRFAQGLGHELSVRVYERVLHQPYPYHLSQNSSKVLAGVQKVGAVVGAVLSPTLDAFTATVLALAILGGLVAIDAVVAPLAALLFGVTYWGLSRLSRTRVLANSRVVSRSQTQRVLAMQEGLGGIRDLLLEGSQSLQVARFQRYGDAMRRAQVQNSLWAQLPRYLTEGLGISIVAGLAVFTASRAGGLAQALPVLGALALGAQRLLPLFQRVYQGWNAVVGSRGSLEDVAALVALPLPPHAGERGDPAALPFTRGVAVRGLGFRYQPQAPWVFRNLSLTIPRGARVGFAGETGCGKSTLLDLVMGLLTPAEGAVEVDGVPITTQNARHWQARIAHVPQQIYLADASVAQNIAFGEPPERIDMTRVQEAARRASVHAFIAGLPQGYATEVGERGVRLSGGQRQRMGIARALYRHADVLVLDEATSALDGETEASVMESIGALGADVTVLMVAHRLSTLDGCERVVHFAEGTIAEHLTERRDTSKVAASTSS
jgi:ABC-type multidrug transport system fused ATPase/permease subunit